MKKPEYIEGEPALRNFQSGMKALFQVSKQDLQKKAARQQKKAATGRKKNERNNGKA